MSFRINERNQPLKAKKSYKVMISQDGSLEMTSFGKEKWMEHLKTDNLSFAFEFKCRHIKD